MYVSGVSEVLPSVHCVTQNRHSTHRMCHMCLYSNLQIRFYTESIQTCILLLVVYYFTRDLVWSGDSWCITKDEMERCKTHMNKTFKY